MNRRKRPSPGTGPPLDLWRPKFPGLLPMGLALILLLSSLMAFPAAAGSQEVRVGLYNAPPFIFTSKSGKPAGLFVDITEELARAEGWQLRYVPGTWAEGLERLEKGEIDLVNNITFTAEREKHFSFNKVPVFTTWSIVYAGKGSGIVSILDLKGKRVSVLQGSIHESGFLRVSEGFDLGVTLLPVQDTATGIGMVARREADACITSSITGALLRKQYGLTQTAVVFNALEDHYAATKGDPKGLLAAIDRHLAAMKDNPLSIYFVALKRWLPEEETFAIPAWLWIAGAALLAGLLLTLVGATVLRRQVAARTQELQEINQEMEERILLRTAELATAMEKAQAADRIKSAFLAIMSHELRTPLNSIIGFTGILLQGLAGPFNPEQNKQLGMVQNSSRHLLTLINDVLDISKIEAGQVLLSPTTFDVRAAIDKTVTLILPLAAKKDLAVNVHLPETPIVVTTDQRRFEQIALNLLSNGVKFTEKGAISVDCRLEAGHCVLSVTDTGIGLRPEDIPEIFQPFQQIDTGLTRKHEGTGLGLSICKKLLELMHGRIEVVSQLGQGSTFTVSFPRAHGGADA